MDDKRFAHVGWDPKFRSMSRQEKKVKIDKRFNAMFKEKRFRLKYTVDKRGRPVNVSSSEDLKRYYETNGQSDEDSKEDDNEVAVEPVLEEQAQPESGGDGDGDISDNDRERKGDESAAISRQTTTKPAKSKHDKQRKSGTPTANSRTSEKNEDKSVPKPRSDCVQNAKQGKKKKKPVARKEVAEEEPLADDVRGRLHDLTVDYARGGGVLVEDSSSDDESEPEEEEVDHDWAELDRDAARIDAEEATARLALCNMDWDRIKAADVMVLMHSFLPPGAVIDRVTIYPSEFGVQRMAEEDEKGPPELFDKEDEVRDSSEDDEPQDDTAGAELRRMEYVRRYQLSRLRYYYAVVECDSARTAAALYDQCDGLEFESSASRLDLRFVPDDMTFDQEAREECRAMPAPGQYRPSQFVTKALQQRRVELTWDETDVRRQEAVRRVAAGGANVDDADIQAYLADSSSESEEDAERSEDEADRQEDEQERIAKYRALLAGADNEDEKKEDEDMEMEITWGEGIKEKTEEIIKKKEQAKDQTPWEKYLTKQHQKKRAKSAAQKETAAAEQSDDSGSDIPSDLADDPFFKEAAAELKHEAKSNKKQKNKKDGNGKNRDGSKRSNADEQDLGEKDQLALLTMDDGDDDGRAHFDFKQIVKDEASSGKKKKWRKKRKPAEETKAPDNFKVDVADPRFEQLYHSSSFNMDPSDPRYRRTAGTERLAGEKQRRLAAGQVSAEADQEPESKKARTAPTVTATSELGALVNTIKSRAKRTAKKTAKNTAKNKT